ncbi:signal peptidase I [Pseudomarimonas salicorniae]|uniref:Signal peptidase I n=1 Tax=Pseudomarimonas salicorniae TaxID=2933270 RepID=A0ABT0GJT7_9GAMM|nr:signal peptidase I [Lysobacter sp. CAU 1642]MCK7594806.1 signal peptidase I [Lysobacter sp. CAU 1642]
MSVDFAAILVALSALTGLIWAADALFFARKRAERAGGAEVAEPVVVEYARSFFPVIFIVLLIRSFLAEPFRIPSSSMMPTLLIGDFILVNKFAYGLKVPVLDYKFVEIGEPDRGDIVVFRYPVDPRQDYIKRVVGLPGDEVIYRSKRLFINGEEVAADSTGRYVGTGSGADMTGAQVLEEKLGEQMHQILQRPEAFRRGDGEGRWVVPEGHYFVMGDNRDNSLDSRYWAFVPEKNLVGRAFLIWMNWDSRNGGVDFSRIGTVIH